MYVVKWARRLLSCAVAVGAVAVIVGSSAQSTRTTIDLKTGPLVNSSDVSNLALVLSVEFPTVGAAYRNRSSGYVQGTKYTGYYDSSTCYVYNGSSTDGYFQPSGATNANYLCNQSGTGAGFSGNLLNFVNTSAVDIMRLALTGGDRYLDEATTATGQTEPRTVLQRAILPSDTTGARNTNFYDGDTGYDSGNKNWDKLTLASGTLTAALTPFGSSTQVVVKACKDEIYFGNAAAGSCASPGTNANLSQPKTNNPAGTTVTGTFKARVQVCSGAEGPSRPDLCQLQPSGRYKPVGQIQLNADKVRVAAFGYLIDSADWQTSNENTRYGGVLRAPMKFAGPNQKSANGIVSANGQNEWDATSGVFVAKPISTTNETGYTYTGVINYINRFGRLVSGTDIYKRRDPVGELFYESLRYFQGQQPTPTAVSGTTTTLLAGYPLYATWSDPMQTSCQRNYAMIIADNNTNQDTYLPGGTVSDQGDGTRAVDTFSRTAPDGTSKSVTFNADTWAKVVSSFETNGTVGYVDSQGVSRVANGNGTGATGVQSGAPYNALATQTNGSGGGHLYVGATYWANTQSIRPDKPLARLRTFVIDVDEGGNGTLDRSRHLYLAGKYGGFADLGGDGSYATGEGNPFRTYVNGTLSSSSVEWLANDGSTSPSGYFLASQPDRLIAAIKKIFAEASKPSGNLSGVSLNVTRVNSAQTTAAVYRALPSITDSSGTIVRTDLTYNTATGLITAAATPTWDAANILTGIQASTTTLAPFPTPANRKIFTFSRTSMAGATFTWANIDASVQTALKTNPSTAVVESDTAGQNRLNYIRGDRSNEPTYRSRNLVMGDIINSAPVLKGAPTTAIQDTGYQTFYSANKSRTPTLYVGANDGMLHAFRAADSRTETTNGQELFAFVPRAVSGKLNKLTDPNYSKDAYVDGSLVVDEAKIYRPSTGALGWATVLAGGMGGGAQGVFALDVTDPTSAGTSSVLWEFTDTDDADMGNLVAEPRIVKLAVNGTAATTPTYKWFVLVTSGFNNYKVDGSQSADGKQALFLLSLEKAPGAAWALGTNYYKIYANDTAFSSTTLATGMGMPGVSTTSAGAVDIAYAGDLQGNLWKFDLTGGATTWTGSSSATVLFLAADAAGNKQPITVVPLVLRHPLGGNQVVFGTGKFLEPSDALAAAASQQSLYGVWDAGDSRTVRRSRNGTTNGLYTRTIAAATTASVATLSGAGFVYGTSQANPSINYRGWFADFLSTYERLVVDPTQIDVVTAANSTIPGGDPCSGTGSANQFRFDALSGKSFANTTISNLSTSSNTNVLGAGYLGSPTGFNLGDPTWSSRDSTGRYVYTDSASTMSGNVNGLSNANTPVRKVTGRMSWREITNFQ